MTNHEFSLLLVLLLIVISAATCLGLYGLVCLFDRLRLGGRKKTRRGSK